MQTCRDCLVEKPLDHFNKRCARCKPCQLVYIAAWRKANPDKLRAQTKRYKDKNRDRLRAQNLARYHQLMATDPDSVRAQRLAYAKTPKGAIYNRLAAHKRRGVRYDAEAREYVALILKDPCVYCGGGAVEVDHVTPITKGGSGHSSNLAPACRSCNARKNDESLLVFMLRLKQAA
jgi:5-methylcytosine-specific restriction endonuclease McrA